MDTDTTLAQIGKQTLWGIGARDLLSGEDFLSFKISRGHRRVTITLNGDDTYTVIARMIRSGRVTYSAEHIYCDQFSEAVWQSHLERN